MELIHIHRDDSPDGVRINLRDYDPNLHRLWVAPKNEPEIETVEIAGLQEPIASELPPELPPDHHNKRTTKRRG
jgi:hypothetical protein